MAEETNITAVWKGDDLQFVITLIPSAVPVGGVAGWTTEFKLATTKGGVAILTVTGAVTDALDGEFTVPIPYATSVQLGTRTYYWDFRRVDAGSRDTLAYGTVNFNLPNT